MFGKINLQHSLRGNRGNHFVGGAEHGREAHRGAFREVGGVSADEADGLLHLEAAAVHLAVVVALGDMDDIAGLAYIESLEDILEGSGRSLAVVLVVASGEGDIQIRG